MKALVWTVAATGLVSLCLVGLKRIDHGTEYYRVGQAIACANDFPFKDGQAEILAFGLENVRGLACDANGANIFIAEANRSLLQYSTLAEGERLKVVDPGFVCPEQPCNNLDRRGLAFSKNLLYAADHNRGRIALISISSLKDYDQTAGLLTGPSGIAAVDDVLFFTDDRPWPGPASLPSPYDVADYSRWIDKSIQRPFGAIYTCDMNGCKLIDAAIHHPSGIAALTARGPIVVAEADGNEVRWPVYEYLQQSQKWIKNGALGSAPAAGEPVSPFLGVAVEDSHQRVFAAGPGGLYVFSVTGMSLGRVMFDDPVTGVATHGDFVYLVVGHTLCRLRITLKPSDGALQSSSAQAPPMAKAPREDPPVAGAKHSELPNSKSSSDQPGKNELTGPPPVQNPGQPPKPGRGVKPEGGSQPQSQPRNPQPSSPTEANGPPPNLDELVYFDYDKSAIRSDAQPVLNRSIRVIQGILVKKPQENFLLEGRGDDRGSNKYNLDLGKARALAVEKSLKDAMIPKSQLTVKSLGKDQPLCLQVSEHCRERNRSVRITVGR